MKNSQKPLIYVISTTICLFALLVLATGCPGKLLPSNASTDAVSFSEIAEAVISGAVNATSTNGTQAHNFRYEKTLTAQIEAAMSLIPSASAAYSSGGCATVQQGDVNFGGADCAVLPGPPASLNIAYSPPCNNVNPFGVWSGGENLTLTSSSVAITFTCGTPPPFVSGVNIFRTFAVPTGRVANPLQANVAPIIGSYPINVLVDTSSTCVSPQAACAGYKHPVTLMGETISFTGPVARSIQINGLHISGLKNGYVVWDFTVSTPNNINIDTSNNVIAGDSAQIMVQNNLTRVTTISTIPATFPLTYTPGCGVPTSGKISTTITDGTPNAVTGPFAPETLTFNTSCATATLVNTQGTNSSYTLYHSY